MKKKSCGFCSDLARYTGSYANYNYLPDNLRLRMRSISLKGDEGEILCCPECGAYYYFLESTPGGSDDAMVTTVYQTFYEIKPFNLYMALYPDITRTEAEFFLKNAGQVMDGAIEYLSSGHSEKVADVYRDEVRASEKKAALILADNIKTILKPPRRLFVMLAGLLDIKNDGAREIILSALLNLLDKTREDADGME